MTIVLIAALNLAAALPAFPAALKPWYTPKLEALGFQVFDPPAEPKDFRVMTLTGTSKLRSSSKGKIVLLNFWATWCPPCKAEIPSIEVLFQSMKDLPFEVFAVDLGEAPLAVKTFVDENKVGYPVYLDPTNSLARAYASQGIPTTYILDKSGKFIASMVGSYTYSKPEFLSLLKEMAAK
ncbi:MAG: TlpA disulfide reductase family protein [Spirochaetes bacterium]|nr:TlpA disulfide reductase family protein [Spirochaetota bacterium]